MDQPYQRPKEFAELETTLYLEAKKNYCQIKALGLEIALLKARAAGEVVEYKYSNGWTFVRINPLLVFKKLLEVGDELAVDVKVISSQAKEDWKQKSESNIANQVRIAFSVQPLEEGGLTNVECGTLLAHFVEWCGDLMKRYPPSEIV